MKGIAVLFIGLSILLASCGCSMQSPPAIHADAAATGERINASQAYYDGLVRSDPDNATAWLIRGMYYNDAFGQYGEALRSYNRSLELDSSSGTAWYAKGIALRNLHRFNESDASLEQARKLGFPVRT